MPSFVKMTGPGEAFITDDAAIAITTVLTPAVVTGFTAIIAQIGNAEVPGTVLAELGQISYNLSRIADSDKVIAKALSDLNVAIGTISSAASESNAIQSMAVANQIKTSNFQIQATKDALKRADLPEPVVPEIKEQIKTAVTDGIEFGTIAAANGAINAAIKSTVQGTATWIAGTSAYQTIEGYLKQAKDSVLSIQVPSPESILSRTKAATISQVGPS
jgi:hypothetical protein